MKKTLCKISSGIQEFEWYLVVDENNDLILSQVNEDPNFNGDDVCLVYNYNSNSMNELFDILANTEHPKNINKNSEGVYMLLSGAMFKCFKDLLEKGLKIPQHQMPNIPNNHGHQMHNIAPVYNPQDRRIVRNTMDGRGYNRSKRNGWEGVNRVFNPCECGPCNIF